MSGWNTGASASPTGLSQAEPASGLGPSGFDPSRVQIDLVEEIRICLKRAYEWADNYPDDPAAALFVRCADCLASVEHAAVFEMRRRDSDGSPKGRDAERGSIGEAATGGSE